MRMEDVGPALKRLRVSKGLTQEAVAVKFGRQVQTVSRLEQSGSNPQVTTLLRYLNALGADLNDLQDMLDNPLTREIQEDDKLLEADGSYRELVRGMLSDLSGEQPVPEVKALLDRIDDLDKRLKRVEASRRAKAVSNGGDQG